MAKQTFTTGQVLTAAQMTSLQQTAMGGGSTTAKTASYVLVAADAGTVVQMNSASATTITVNTALFAAGDTVQIQNVGAGVCTVTAGTATVSTSAVLALKQYDAGNLYFNSTSAALFFAADAADNTSPLTTKGDLYGFSTLNARIPIGTNNQVLTADSAEALGLKWATPAGGGGKVLQVVSATTSTAVTISTTANTDTGITATITPTLNTSKILVLISGSVWGSAASVTSYFYGGRLLRGATAIMDQGAYGLAGVQVQGSSATQGVGSNIAINYYDAPATTSATTYKFQARTHTTGALYWQQDSLSASTIVLMEIGV